jgi:hypothetical protein
LLRITVNHALRQSLTEDIKDFRLTWRRVRSAPAIGVVDKF